MKPMGKPTMKYGAGGMAKMNNKPIQTIDDMLRIAKKVNVKLKNTLHELDKEIENCKHVIENTEKGERIPSQRSSLEVS